MTVEMNSTTVARSTGRVKQFAGPVADGRSPVLAHHTRPLRIAMIGQKGIPAHSGGVEQHVEHLARELTRRGHRVTVYCRRSYWNSQPAEQAAVGDASHQPAWPRRLFRPSIPTKHLDTITHCAVSTIDALLGDADLVHFHAIGPAALSPLPKLARIPVVATVHGLDWQRAKWGPAARRCLRLGQWLAARFANQLVVVSEPLRDYFARQYGLAAHFIPNGVVPIPHRPARRILALGIRPKQYVLSASRLVPEKGLHYLIEAYGRVRTDCQLVIAGGGGLDGSYQRRLQAMAGPGVIFTGNADRDLLAELYSNALLFVLPSEIEGMSVALLEAMSCGLPTLVSDIAENRCVVGRRGFTFRSGDAADLADKLAFLLDHAVIMEQYGRQLRRQSAIYRWPYIAARLEKVYLLATSRNPPARPSAVLGS